MKGYMYVWFVESFVHARSWICLYEALQVPCIGHVSPIWIYVEDFYAKFMQVASHVLGNV
jgi:hypothetical protein